ncbi:MFS transporter [Leptolyngbya sp. BC1307]|uniref:MFS transporter n=1 Tax=Leptolyngbya sp. BC1307 TaxID=2029589 RepID=UPI000EFC1F2D|nr:MFS transporter [Leptolyngbya sp. BC1307]
MANLESQSELHADSPSPALTLPVKLAYGAGDFGAGLTSQFLAFFLLIFLIDVAGMRPVVAGSVLALGKIWDAVNDPLVGVLSDRTKTRWGRRYPWMFLTAIPFGLSYFLIWIAPFSEDTSSAAKFWYYVVVTTIFQVFFTTTNLPYTTLTAEMTGDYDERTELTSFRLAFSVAGGVAILIAAGIFGQLIADDTRRYAVLGLLGGAISIASIYWCIFGTYGYMDQKAKAAGRSLNAIADIQNESFLQQFRVVASNRPFLFVVGIYLFSWLALQITAAVIPFYAKFWMGVDENLVALIVQGTAIVMMFVCAALSKRIGKKNLYFLGSGVWILVQIALFFLQPGQTTILYGLCILASFGVATAYIVPWSILPDVIELDELNTGCRREGTFYAFMTLLQKIGLAVGIFLVGAALEASGFVKEAAQQPESALNAIRFFMGPVPLVLVICGVVLIYFYPITREAHAEIMLKLAERKRLEAKPLEETPQ